MHGVEKEEEEKEEEEEEVGKIMQMNFVVGLWQKTHRRSFPEKQVSQKGCF